MKNEVAALKKVKEHSKRYPVLLSRCHESAKAYATCVIRGINLEKNNCQVEFNNFRVCLLKNAIERKF